MGPQYSWQRFWRLALSGRNGGEYIDADEIYYAYYMKHISGPWSEESRDWLKDQRNEFIPMLETQKRVNSGDLSSDALLAYSSLQQKYSVYQRVVESKHHYYLKRKSRCMACL